MTRINLVPPEELCDQHLLAEFRELTRIPSHVAKGKADLAGQPEDYVLGKGHVRFFFDKMRFLRRRHLALAEEIKARGFKAESRWPAMQYDPKYWNDYVPTEEALALNRARIADRMPQKPRFTPKRSDASMLFLTGDKDPLRHVAGKRFTTVGCPKWRPVV